LSISILEIVSKFNKIWFYPVFSTELRAWRGERGANETGIKTKNPFTLPSIPSHQGRG